MGGCRTGPGSQGDAVSPTVPQYTHDQGKENCAVFTRLMTIFFFIFIIFMQGRCRMVYASMYLGRTHPPPSPFFLISSLTLSNQLLLGLYLLLLPRTSIPFRPPSYVALIFSHQMPIHLQCFPELPLLYLPHCV